MMSKRFDVTIAGEINLDLILYGLDAQMPVERELLASGFRATLGSSSAIVAHNLAALGMAVGFVTRVGDDRLGSLALEFLETQGVDLSCIRRVAGKVKTGVTVLLDHRGSRHILTYPGTMSEMTREDIDFAYLASSRHFHIASLYLLKDLKPSLPSLCRELKAQGLTISLDTNDDPDDLWGAPLDELLGLVDIFLPNEDEARRITGLATAEEALASLAARVPLVAVKCGRRGALVQQAGERWSVPGEDVRPVDTIGAGDSFDAGFIAAYLRGASPEQCAAYGNRTGAYSTLSCGGVESFRDRALFNEWFR